MGKIKILFVDDEKDFLEVMSARLKGWGYDLIEVLSGTEAVAAIKNNNPDIVILDYLLADTDGISLLKKIRSTNEKLPVIMFTAYPDSRTMQGGEELGISAFIPKLSECADVIYLLKAAINMIEKDLDRPKPAV